MVDANAFEAFRVYYITACYFDEINTEIHAFEN